MSENNAEGGITVEVEGRILLMGINRPSKMNGFTPEMIDDLADAYTRLDDDPELWSVSYTHLTLPTKRIV